MLIFPHQQGLTRCNGYKRHSNDRQNNVSSFGHFWFFIKFTLKKLLSKQELPSLQDNDNRFSRKVQNVPQKLRITRTCCEVNNVAGPQYWTGNTNIPQYTNIQLQTNLLEFKPSFHIVHSAHIYGVNIVLKFLNHPGLWLEYFSKGSYQDSHM